MFNRQWPRLPTRWEYFGLSGPTNKHNLDLMYYERLRIPFLSENGPAYTEEQYRECLAEIGADDEAGK